MTVTVVESGTQHNVIPDTLHFVIDVRTNEFYQNEYLFEFLCKKMTKCELKARSFRLHSSSIPQDHPLIRRCMEHGMQPFGSPTLSDQALMPFPSFKLGPGDSSRSHSADEYIKISEIQQAIDTYVSLLDGLTRQPSFRIQFFISLSQLELHHAVGPYTAYCLTGTYLLPTADADRSQIAIHR